MNLSTVIKGTAVSIALPGLSLKTYRETARLIEAALRNPSMKNRDVIQEAFLFALSHSPRANPSDLWHHVVYRIYCDVYSRYQPQDPKQSWVRASGEALELAVEALYAPVLLPYGIGIKALISGAEKFRALSSMGLTASVGSAKLDVALYVNAPQSPEIFGGVHVKASLAERISDDVPCSRAMMQRGYFSPLWTLDVKSFPPPLGDLINRGELGTPIMPSDKRRYIEEHGEFDNCYSANARTVPSAGTSRSGKLVITLDIVHQPDSFATDVIQAGSRFASKLVV